MQPGSTLTVDESMSGWRGRSLVVADEDEEGQELHVGLPHTTKIARKPVGVGLEIRNICCATTGILMGLELQKGKGHMGALDENKLLGSGTASIIRLSKPFHGSGRTVCADSAFASVKTAAQLHRVGLRFIGLVKTATKQYPIARLRSHNYPARGAHVVMKAKDADGVVYTACGWKDKTVKTWIATCGVTIPAKTAALKKRFRLADGEVKVYLKPVPRPSLAEQYFDAANAIDVHNHYRQGSLALESTWLTQIWWHRSFATLLGMTVTDAFLAACYFYPGRESKNFSTFVDCLCSQLVTNTEDLGPAAAVRTHVADPEPPPASDLGFLPLSSLPKYRDVTKKGNRARRRCRVCTRTCSHFCTACSQKEHIVGICNPAGKRSQCWKTHAAGWAHMLDF